MNNVSAQEIFDMAPMTFPMTHIHHLPDGTPLPMVTRYPIADWKEKGEPYMTSVGWAKLSVAIARNNTALLGDLFNCAHELLRNAGGETSPSVGVRQNV